MPASSSRPSRRTRRAALLTAAALGATGLLSLTQTPASGPALTRTGVSVDAAAVSAVSPVTAPVTRGSRTSFAVNRNSNRTVTRWNPCDGPIHVRINPGPTGAAGLADARTALATVAARTGLKFAYVGTTRYVPTKTNRASAPAALVVAWTTPGTGAGQSNLFQSGAIGEGGWRSTATSVDGGRTWNWKIASGYVVLDSRTRMAGGFGRGLTRGSLLLHELGHAVGLNHSADAAQVMYPSLSSRSFGSYGAGDAAGLAAVGASHGCTRAS